MKETVRRMEQQKNAIKQTQQQTQQNKQQQQIKQQQLTQQATQHKQTINTLQQQMKQIQQQIDQDYHQQQQQIKQTQNTLKWKMKQTLQKLTHKSTQHKAAAATSDRLSQQQEQQMKQIQQLSTVEQQITQTQKTTQAIQQQEEELTQQLKEITQQCEEAQQQLRAAQKEADEFEVMLKSRDLSNLNQQGTAEMLKAIGMSQFIETMRRNDVLDAGLLDTAITDDQLASVIGMTRLTDRKHLRFALLLIKRAGTLTQPQPPPTTATTTTTDRAAAAAAGAAGWWSVDEIMQWLSTEGRGVMTRETVMALKRAGVDGAVLVMMTPADIKQLLPSLTLGAAAKLTQLFQSLSESFWSSALMMSSPSTSSSTTSVKPTC